MKPTTSMSQALVLDRRAAITSYGEISYLEAGAGPVAVFVHGVLLNAHLWDGTIAALHGGDGVDGVGRRCVALDLMGHGETRSDVEQDLSFGAQADMLAAFVEALGVEAVDLVGNDSGGAICQIFAARHPGQVRTLTLTNCDTHDNVLPPDLVPLVELSVAGQALPMFESMLDDPQFARAFLASTVESAEVLSDAVIRAFTEPLVRNERSQRTIQRWMTALSATDLVAAEVGLTELQAPTLVVWGTDDVFFDVAWAHWLAGLIPGSVGVVEVPGARLFFPLERPGLLAGHILGLWQTR